jgi:hypothetical protein
MLNSLAKLCSTNVARSHASGSPTLQQPGTRRCKVEPNQNVPISIEYTHIQPRAKTWPVNYHVCYVGFEGLTPMVMKSYCLQGYRSV